RWARRAVRVHGAGRGERSLPQGDRTRRRERPQNRRHVHDRDVVGRTMEPQTDSVEQTPASEPQKGAHLRSFLRHILATFQPGVAYGRDDIIATGINLGTLSMYLHV